MRTHCILTLCLSSFLALGVRNSLVAQDRQASTPPKVPLEQLLNRDGTLDLKGDFRGSLDPAGWKMLTGPNGEPRFVPADIAQPTAGADRILTAPVDENWEDRFGTPGPDNNVEALAISGNEVYAGGDFMTAGGVVANRIAKWDGTSWSALGSGMNGAVRAIAVSGSVVYAGGVFTRAGGVPAYRVAKWDGTSWSALGSGMDGEVRAIAVSGSDVYAGGSFTTAGGDSASYIAKWDGTKWSALGRGVNGGVSAIAVSGSSVYVGGGFTTAGGIAANRIARWDGTSWSALGRGMDAAVTALAVSGSEVYAGGAFYTADEVVVGYIAKWDGTSWSALGGGVDSFVYALAVSGSEVYAGGWLSTAGGIQANYIAKWDGASWSALGSGADWVVKAIAVSGAEAYVGGQFTSVGGVAASYIAKWDGAKWSGLVVPKHSVDSYIEAIAVSGSDVFVGGVFMNAGGTPARRIAKWDGTNWSPLGSGMNGEVAAIAVSGGEVYVGGGFRSAGGIPASFIAKWDGTSWSALGSGLNNAVYAIAVNGREVYAGGYFTTAGGVPANHIAKWDGTSWSALGSGVNTLVRAIAVSGHEVYAGGDFTTAGGVSADYIAKWDGASWSALGSGMDNSVHALAVSDSEVYVGGLFSTAGDVPANKIAKWDGASWSALGSGITPAVYAIAVSGHEVYAAGDFTVAGGVRANYIAKWDGTRWSALGSGMDGLIYAVAVSGGEVYAGGSFTVAGGKASFYFALWHSPTPIADAGPDQRLCFGQSTQIGGNPAALGGTPPYMFTWSPTSGLEDATTPNPTASPAATTDYTLTVTDAAGLTASDQVKVTVDPLPVVTFDPVGPFLVTDSPVDLSAFGSPAGGTYSGPGISGSMFDPATAGIGIHTVVYTFSDANHCSSNASRQITVEGAIGSDFVFIANDLITLDRFEPSEGNIHSNREIVIRKGLPSMLTGNLTAVGDIRIRVDNTINGDATAGGKVNSDGVINGSESDSAKVEPELPPQLSFSAGGSDISVPRKASLSLAPGSYGTVVVDRYGTLQLHGGTYFFDKLMLVRDAVLAVEVTEGAVQVNVVSKLDFDRRVHVVPSSGETASMHVTFTSLQTSRLLIGERARVLGSIIAPRATVVLSRNCRFRGTISANAVDVSRGAVFLPHCASSQLPKVELAGLDDLDAEQEVASDITTYELAPNYPNPFNPSTTIKFTLPDASFVTLRIFSVIGRLVRTLTDGEMNAGMHEVSWNSRNDSGVTVASGVYYCQIVVRKPNGAAVFKKMRRMMLVR